MKYNKTFPPQFIYLFETANAQTFCGCNSTLVYTKIKTYNT